MLARRVLAALLLASRADALSTASVLRKISPLHVDRYEREGVVVVRGLVDADVVELLRREVDGAVASRPARRGLGARGTGKSYFTDLELSTRRPALRAFAAEGSAACAAALLMKSRTSTFLYDQIFVKHARDPAAAAAATVFHQDAPYWSVEGSQIASVSIALDDVDERDCLDFLPGTHRLPEFQPVHFASGEPYESESPLPTLDVAALGGPRARFDLSPGDAVAFDGRLAHGGAGSSGGRRRRRLRHAAEEEERTPQHAFVVEFFQGYRETVPVTKPVMGARRGVPPPHYGRTRRGAVVRRGGGYQVQVKGRDQWLDATDGDAIEKASERAVAGFGSTHLSRLQNAETAKALDSGEVSFRRRRTPGGAAKSIETAFRADALANVDDGDDGDDECASASSPAGPGAALELAKQSAESRGKIAAVGRWNDLDFGASSDDDACFENLLPFLGEGASRWTDTTLPDEEAACYDSLTDYLSSTGIDIIIRPSFAPPAPPTEVYGIARGSRVSAALLDAEARRRLGSTFEFKALQDMVNALAFEESDVGKRLVELRLGLRATQPLVWDVLRPMWCLAYLLEGEQATAAGLVLRPVNFQLSWAGMQNLPEIVKYYGSARFARVSDSVLDATKERTSDERANG
ncbi:hypothetical protein JL721_10524 [Aureococcus anophagefferens]|nr:hypothetical protein JL721_10524 [Aureococcus anophagefferens]